MLRPGVLLPLILLVLFCALSFAARGFNPRIIETPSQNDVLPLRDPQRVQTLYGHLEGYPHMYEFATKEKLDLSVEIFIPDEDGARTTISGIVLRVNPNGSVSEISRLRAREATWESHYAWWEGVFYRRGASYRGVLEPGSYKVELSAPDNLGTYAVRVGTKHHNTLFGYGSHVSNLMDVLGFLGRSHFLSVRSPLLFIPLLTLMAAGGLFWYRRAGRPKVQ